MYENLIDPQIQILERCQIAWDNMASTSEDLSSYVPGLTKSNITKSFTMVIGRLNKIKAQSLKQVSPFLIQTLSQNFPSWTGPLESWIATSPSNTANIYSHLGAMWSQLNTFDNEPNIPSIEEIKILVSENKRLQSEAKNLLKLTTNLTKKNSDLSEVLAQAKKFSRDSKELLEEALKSKATIDSDALVTLAHRESIVKDQIDSASQLVALNAITEKIPEFEQKRNAITKQCDDILAEAKDRLDAASRAGMATSFSYRASEYMWPRRFWLTTFIASLIGIFGVAYCFIIPELIKLQGSDRLLHFITDIPLTLPFIWLAWFSALRFSQLGRLREDYAFKVATELSLDGYRKQATEVNTALAEKLLDLAITNFGENPLRLMTKESAKDAHPLAGIIDEKTLSEILKSGIQSISNKVNK